MKKIQYNLQAFCIDLDHSKPEVLDYSGHALQEDMELMDIKCPLDLDTWDRKVFLNESEADAYLSRYEKMLKKLDNTWICNNRELPCMLYKRRYIVQTLLGEKNHTIRHYKKDWKPGQLFNLHDQVFFLTVRLKKITEVNGEYRYDFELP